MADDLPPATDLAAQAHHPYPGESVAYTKARTALIAEEVELRRMLERVAAHRRALPEAPVVTKDYSFEGKDGTVHLADLFERHDTLVTYCYMFGPERDRPCPMCTQFVGALAANALDLRQRIGLAVIARSPFGVKAAHSGRGRSCCPFTGPLPSSRTSAVRTTIFPASSSWNTAVLPEEFATIR